MGMKQDNSVSIGWARRNGTIHFTTEATDSNGNKIPAAPTMNVQPVLARATETKNEDGSIKSQGFMITFRKDGVRMWVPSRTLLEQHLLTPKEEGSDEGVLNVEQLGWDSVGLKFITAKVAEAVAQEA